MLKYYTFVGITVLTSMVTCDLQHHCQSGFLEVGQELC